MTSKISKLIELGLAEGTLLSDQTTLENLGRLTCGDLEVIGDALINSKPIYVGASIVTLNYPSAFEGDTDIYSLGEQHDWR